jgi:hypothetical protein
MNLLTDGWVISDVDRQATSHCIHRVLGNQRFAPYRYLQTLPDTDVVCASTAFQIIQQQIGTMVYGLPGVIACESYNSKQHRDGQETNALCCVQLMSPSGDSRSS